MFEFNDCEVMLHCFVVPKRLLEDIDDIFEEDEEEDDEELANE